MRKNLTLVVAALVLMVACKWGWDHRPWKKIFFQGYVEGDYVYVASPVAGRLESLGVHRGESVVAGQALFQLDKNPEQQQMREAQARALLAEQNAQRSRELIKSKSISMQDNDQAESNLTTALENLSQIAWKLDQKKQSAQEEAYVQDTYFVQGEWVAEGRPVVSLLPPGNIKIRFYVNASTRAGLRQGQALRLNVFGSGSPVSAVISYLSSQAEYTPPVIYSNDTREKLTFLIEALPEISARSRLKPGQPVEVVVE
jgi:HlyD family secretion protein